jgi:hypothetical protein
MVSSGYPAVWLPASKWTYFKTRAMLPEYVRSDIGLKVRCKQPLLRLRPPTLKQVMEHIGFPLPPCMSTHIFATTCQTWTADLFVYTQSTFTCCLAMCMNSGRNLSWYFCQLEVDLFESLSLLLHIISNQHGGI